MNEELKPCAHCGNEHIRHSNYPIPVKESTFLIYIRCLKCGIRTEGSYYTGDFNWGYNQAIEPEIQAWNKRYE